MGLTPGRDAARWIARAALAGGVAALAGVALHPFTERSIFEHGLLYPVTRNEQVLSLLGFGLLLTQSPPRQMRLNVTVFLVCVPLGSVVSSLFVAALVAGANVQPIVYAMAPACCVVTGAALIAPDKARNWLTPPVAIFCGIVLGIVFNVDATREERVFAVGVIITGLWLAAAPVLVAHRFTQTWFRIATRIYGGWIVAIGTMLAALELIPGYAA